MGTGEWIVAAVETTADEAADRIDIRIAGPFVDQEAADKFAAEAEREGLVVEVSRMYAPERGVEEFAIGNR